MNTTPSKWMAPTFRDTLPPDAGNPIVQCPCGRRTNADMLSDVRALPHGHPMRQAGEDFICDGCRERHHESGAVARDAFVRALGAPPDVVEHHRLYHLRRQAARTEAGRLALEQALASPPTTST